MTKGKQYVVIERAGENIAVIKITPNLKKATAMARQCIIENHLPAKKRRIFKLQTAMTGIVAAYESPGPERYSVEVHEVMDR